MTSLNIGAWEHRIPGYTGIDANPTPAADVVMRVPPLDYADGSIAHVYAGHFVEHLPPWDVLPFLSECARVLATGGTLTLVVPDAQRVSVLAGSQVLGGPGAARILIGADGADMGHWTLWTRARLEDALRRVGFSIDEHYDYRTDERVYDRQPSWQSGARGVK